MNANVTRRVEKLEQATGINVPCAACELGRRLCADIDALIREHGLEAQPYDSSLPASCPWCGALQTSNLAGFTKEDCALYSRLLAASETGTLCAPENVNLYDDFIAACDRVSRERFGEHFAAVEQMFRDYETELQAFSRTRPPRVLYLCCLPGCTCDYPKTERQARENFTANQLRAH